MKRMKKRMISLVTLLALAGGTCAGCGSNDTGSSDVGKSQAKASDSQAKVSTSSKRIQRIRGQRNISKIVVFFDDGTFQELTQE